MIGDAAHEGIECCVGQRAATDLGHGERAGGRDVADADVGPAANSRRPGGINGQIEVLAADRDVLERAVRIDAGNDPQRGYVGLTDIADVGKREVCNGYRRVAFCERDGVAARGVGDACCRVEVDDRCVVDTCDCQGDGGSCGAALAIGDGVAESVGGLLAGLEALEFAVRIVAVGAIGIQSELGARRQRDRAIQRDRLAGAVARRNERQGIGISRTIAVGRHDIAYGGGAILAGGIGVGDSDRHWIGDGEVEAARDLAVAIGGRNLDDVDRAATGHGVKTVLRGGMVDGARDGAGCRVERQPLRHTGNRVGQRLDIGVGKQGAEVEIDDIAVTARACRQNTCLWRVVAAVDGDRHHGAGSTALTVGCCVAESVGGAFVEIQALERAVGFVGVSTVGVERELGAGRQCDLGAERNRDAVRILSGRYSQQVAVGRGVVIIAEHAAGDLGRVLMRSAAICDRDRRRICDREREGTRGRVGAVIGDDGDGVDAGCAALAGIAVEDPRDETCLGIVRETSRQAGNREIDVGAVDVREGGANVDGDRLPVARRLICRRAGRRVVDRHDGDGGDGRCRRETSSVGCGEGEGSVAGGGVLRGVLVGDAADERVEVGLRHRRGRAERVGEREGFGGAVVGN